MPQRLPIDLEHKFLAKVFRGKYLRGFAEIKTPEGMLFVEIQSDPHYTAIKAKLKRENGSLFTRTMKIKPALTIEEEAFVNSWNPLREGNGAYNVIESIYDTEQQLVLDYRELMVNSAQRKNLRIGNLRTMRSAFFPIIGSEDARNFLEIYRGEYPSGVRKYDDDMLAYPRTIFYGPSYFDISVSSVDARKNQVSLCINNSYNEKRGNIASIEERNGEKMALVRNGQSGQVTFLGTTKEHGSIIISSDLGDNNIPDINLSIFPSLVEIVSHFDIRAELEILNRTKREKTIVSALVTEEMTNLIYKVHQASMQKLQAALQRESQ